MNGSKRQAIGSKRKGLHRHVENCGIEGVASGQKTKTIKSQVERIQAPLKDTARTKKLQTEILEIYAVKKCHAKNLSNEATEALSLGRMWINETPRTELALLLESKDLVVPPRIGRKAIRAGRSCWKVTSSVPGRWRS